MRLLPCILAGLIAVAFLAALPGAALAAPAQETAPELLDYAQRDADAGGLADFAGGHSGVILLIVIVVAVIVLVAVLLPW